MKRVLAVVAICLIFASSASSADEQKLLPSTAGLAFGEGMATSEGVLFIGSEQGFSPGNSDSSSGYVDMYLRGSTGWVLSSTLPPPASTRIDRFGGTIAVEGNWMAVLGHVADASFLSTFVFQRVNGAWVPVQRLDRTPTGNPENQTLALHAGHLLLGYQNFDGEGDSTDSGVVAYELQNGAFVGIGELSKPFHQIADLFGHSIAFAGDRLAVGAPRYLDASGHRGVVFTYVFSAGSWVHLIALQADSPSERSFGLSLAACGDTLAVAAPNYLNSAGSLLGYVATYLPTSTSWSEGPAAQPSDPSPPISFASAIGCDGSILGVQARGANLAYRFQLAGTWQQLNAFSASDANYGFIGPVVVSDRDVIVADYLQGSPMPSGAAYAFNDDSLFANGFE